MRANQAAIQRRVNTPRVQTQSPPSYGSSQFQQQQPPQTPSANNSYTPYPSQNTNYSQTTSQNNIQTPPLNAAPSTGKMPPGLNPQQQLQFILNVLGERIAKLENHVAQLSSNPVSLNNGQPQPQQAINPAALQSAIASHPEIALLKESLFKIQSMAPSSESQSGNTASPNVIDDIQANIETIFQYIENDTTPDVSKIQEELQTRTELLATEINQVKDMVLQLQSTVINVLLPAIVSPVLPPAPFSTLENFTQAPLDIIPEDPAIAAAALEKNLEIAELPTLVEPLSYQEF
jgi:hypothetical protein